MQFVCVCVLECKQSLQPSIIARMILKFCTYCIGNPILEDVHL